MKAMNRVLRATTVLALFLTMGTGMAKGPKMNLLPAKEAKGVVLSLAGLSEKVAVSLMDAEQNTIHFERLTEGSLGKKFDMKNLPDGQYWLKTETALSTVLYSIVLEGDAVVIKEEGEHSKPYFRKTREQLMLNFLNKEMGSVDIKVYDGQERLVFSETVKDRFLIEKAFNFSGAYPGEYSVVIADGYGVYGEDFTVR
ncbi:hypothetical protein [Maribacter sp. 2307ULW6-5]|uniref:hypothetical protein n=1 Tax=Maribacter sp. 2307ULW6-5 TaxID=3386275 RepID=UPI0039BCDF86